MGVERELRLVTRLGVNSANIHLEVSHQSPTSEKILRMDHLKNGAGNETTRFGQQSHAAWVLLTESLMILSNMTSGGMWKSKTKYCGEERL